MYSKLLLSPGQTLPCGDTFPSLALTLHRLPLHEVKALLNMDIPPAIQLQCPLHFQPLKLDLCLLRRDNTHMILSPSLFTLLLEAGAKLPPTCQCPIAQTRAPGVIV